MWENLPFSQEKRECAWCPQFCSICSSSFEEPLKNFLFSPTQKQKSKFIQGLEDFSPRLLVQEDILGVQVIFGFWCWRIQILQLGRAKLLKITKPAAWEKLFFILGIHCGFFIYFKCHLWVVVPHEEQLFAFPDGCNKQRSFQKWNKCWFSS